MVRTERSHILRANNFNSEDWELEDRVEEIINLAETANAEISGITLQK